MFRTAILSAALGATLAAPVESSAFAAWKVTHSKTYATAEEEATALAAYLSNEAIIVAHNAKGLSYWLGHNEFSDLTWEQFKERHMGHIYNNKPPMNMNRVHISKAIVNGVEHQHAKLDDAVDWVTAGAVTDVKNQGRCGSCWAFSTTGSMEGAFQIATGKLVSMSEENLVQCDHVDSGCQGGLMDNAFTFIQQNGLCTEADYPYTSGSGITGTCMTPACTPAATNTGHTDVTPGDENALQAAVAQQPVSVAIEADKSAFQMYAGGVLDDATCGEQLDHGVLVVGYGTDSSLSKDYWKVKNSWGTTWGEAGYIRMVRGKNQCGIAKDPSYPTGVGPAGPAPPPGPSPPSPPSPPAGKTHYGDPADGCMADEIDIQVQGVQGDFCAPECSLTKACPTDVPAGVTAEPQCALNDGATGKKYCALICSPSNIIADQKASDAQCGTNASCKPISGVGLCTYDD